MVHAVTAVTPPQGSEVMQAELPRSLARPALPVAPAAAGSETAGGGSSADTAAQGSAALDDMLDQINQSMQAWSTGMRFDLDEDAQRVVVSIVEQGSGKVLRTIPSDAVLRVARMITRLQGAVVNTQA